MISALLFGVVIGAVTLAIVVNVAVLLSWVKQVMEKRR
jgi:hypothetical protein